MRRHGGAINHLCRLFSRVLVPAVYRGWLVISYFHSIAAGRQLRCPRCSSPPPPQLLRFGANIHHVNLKPDGGSALHEAVAHKHEAVVELLLSHGANPFVENTKVGGAGRARRRSGATRACSVFALREWSCGPERRQLEMRRQARAEPRPAGSPACLIAPITACDLPNPSPHPSTTRPRAPPAGLHRHGHCLLHAQRAPAAPPGAVRALCGLAAGQGGAARRRPRVNRGVSPHAARPACLAAAQPGAAPLRLSTSSSLAVLPASPDTLSASPDALSALLCCPRLVLLMMSAAT